MPSCGPIKLKTPGPERWRLTKSSIPPLWQADVRLGKSLVASAPQCVKDKHLENIRSHFRRLLGKGKEVMINVHATFARTKKVDGCKMGNGKGEINHYVARVPAGRVLFHIPASNPFSFLLPSPLPFESRGASSPSLPSPSPPRPPPSVPSRPNYSALHSVVSKMPMACNFRAQYSFFPMDSLDELTKHRTKHSKRNLTKLVQRKFDSEQILARGKNNL
eukprot:GHVT01048498.1.p1 GENE.GHVT01048498.1~~GHVT01048498.1.p1  ORF type:complete len:219 (+),score=35.38 GHVT01048498.1:246-902(+)